MSLRTKPSYCDKCNTNINWSNVAVQSSLFSLCRICFEKMSGEDYEKWLDEKHRIRKLMQDAELKGADR